MVTEVKVISDTHFNDDRMLLYLNRAHKNTDEMNEALIKCWNMKVTPDEICFHLGDLALNMTFDKLKAIVDRLNGIKILIKGNWDDKPNKYYLDLGFKKVYDGPLVIKDYIFSHKPISPVYLKNNPNSTNYHGHSHRYQYGRPYVNCNVDIMGFKPKRVNLWDVKKGDII